MARLSSRYKVRKATQAAAAVCARLGLLLLAAAMLSGQARLTLEQAGSRKLTDFSPAYQGHRISVQGEVPYRPVQMADFYHLHIQDESYHGLTLEGTAEQFAGIGPGDVLEVRGTLSARAGLPVLLPSSVLRIGSRAAQAPQSFRLDTLASFRYIGVLVNTEGRITDRGRNESGEYLTVSDRNVSLRAFLPKKSLGARPGFTHFNIGDKVRLAGVSSQFCPLAPFNSGYEILVDDPDAVALVESGSFLPPLLLVTVLVCVTIAFGIWRVREHRLGAQRVVMRSLNALGEEIISSDSPSGILRKLLAVLPRVSGITGVRLYLVTKGSRSLERVESTVDPNPIAVSLDAPDDPLGSAVALCFKNRTLLNIPDTRRSPFFRGVERGDLPKSVMLIPMLAQSECLGVLEIHQAGSMRFFNRDEQAANQHLGNQIATSLKLQEQQSMREQLFRSEKLAATGQLISGVADELRAPLNSIVSLARSLLVNPVNPGTDRDLRAIASEAHRASEIVEHLVSFTREEQTQAKTIDLNRLMAGLLEFREREWKNRGVQVRNRIPSEPLMIIGSQSQLEQVFLNLMVHAEQSMTAAEKTLTLSTAPMGRKVLVEIGYNDVGEATADPFQDARNGEAGAMGLGVCRGIIHGHGGDIRLVRLTGGGARFEVELPMVQTRPASASPGAEAARAARPMTALLVEQESTVQRNLLSILSGAGHRVVPVTTAEEALDLAQRMRFDIVFCSVRLPGLNWVEFFEKIRDRAGSFVLLSEGYDTDLSRVFQGGDGYLLSKPIQEVEVAHLLNAIETRHQEPAPASPRDRKSALPV